MDPFILPIDAHDFIVCSDLDRPQSDSFAACLKYLIAEGYKICGCKKTARGNAHGGSWQDCLTIVGDGGLFAGFFADAIEKGKTPQFYIASPAVEHIDAFADEEIANWAEPFEHSSSECSVRYVYAESANKEEHARYLFMLEAIHPRPVGKTEDCVKWQKELGMKYLKVSQIHPKKESESPRIFRV